MSKKSEGVNPELIRPILAEEQEKRGWKVEVNGVLVPDVSSVRLVNEKMALEVQYGMRAEGYDGVLKHEPSGGGSVLVPFVVWEGELEIGLLQEERKTQGGIVLNLPRGALDPGETHFETAVREMREETGVSVRANRVKDLGEDARPGNPNSADYDTSREGEGIHFYAIEFYPAELTKVYHSLHIDLSMFAEGVLQLSQDAITPTNKSAERIFSCSFYPWNIAACVADQFSNSGISRLLAYLASKKRVHLTFSMQ